MLSRRNTSIRLQSFVVLRWLRTRWKGQSIFLPTMKQNCWWLICIRLCISWESSNATAAMVTTMATAIIRHITAMAITSTHTPSSSNLRPESTSGDVRK
ncbi:uncharacterized protein EAF01_000799 [Botrytis porri]|uniref:uncharacterized protein n=1 Tax=Botrytis porri TaxID=87229 RepID=UPI001900D6BA|nr:uncharacterized protein EAF01_000799 [Botrytis porri]KAF7914393.1 hypothetical protein EAF01_000799 [Botrytis porri]